MIEQELRDKFLRFFEANGHTVVPSSSLVPHNDPTLLFVNAGMVQFKDVFLGLEQRPYKRATTIQKCVRAGGKHNDLDTVGRTARHHTFFEMLGNFSFGDYFKEDAIKFAWKFITEELKLDTNRLYVTVYKTDDEARAIWKKVTGFPDEKILGMGEKDNFWSMGDTGPCGPCSEIFYDRGAKYSCDAPECAMGVCDCDRWMEIWNLVFMQYNRDAEGNMTPLPNPSIDTGMGLERGISILNDVDSNYEIPIMQSLIGHLVKQTGGNYDKGKNGFPYRVIADHIRSCAFLIADGVLPGNEGRSYVLRRILRRAVRFGKMLGFEKPFMCNMVPLLAELMGKTYPELLTQQDFIIKVIRLEEERFLETINDGLSLVAEVIENLKVEGGKVFSGEKAFQLYDTFGFPLDLTVDIAEENGFEVDKDAFQKAMDEQRNRARAARNEGNVFGELQELTEVLAGLPATEFVGYDIIKTQTKVLALLADGQLVKGLAEGQDGFMVLDKTPCYAEGGGQCGDKASVKSEGIEAFVTDTKKLPNGIYLHCVSVSNGAFKTGDIINIAVDEDRRQKIACNHSVTHLLHHALRDVLGNHVHQAGSMVNEDGLRFDFSHIAALTPDETAKIENIVNSEILKNHAVNIESITKDEAVAKGAMAFFGDKYGDTVRMVTIGPSLELCGGIHCAFTGAIGSFKIVSESSIGSGTRRIEAITGKKVNEWWQERMDKLNRVAAVLKSSWQDVEQRIIDIQEESKQKDKEIQRLQTILAQQAMGSIFEKAVEIEGVKMLAEQVEAADMESLRNTMDMLKDKITSGVAVLAAVSDNKVMLVAAVTQDLLKQGVHAGNIIKAAAAACGGGGGGRPDMAQAGGKDPAKVNDALNAAKQALQAQLQK